MQITTLTSILVRWLKFHNNMKEGSNQYYPISSRKQGLSSGKFNNSIALWDSWTWISIILVLELNINTIKKLSCEVQSYSFYIIAENKLEEGLQIGILEGFEKGRAWNAAHAGQVDFLVRQETIFRAHLLNDCGSRGVIWQLIRSLTKP